MPADGPRPGSAPDPAADVGGLGERGLIAAIRRRLPPAPPWLVVGPGDDAAVAEPVRGELDVLTADALVEGIHFDWRFCAAADVGYKALAVSLSDLAAMGATPRAALLSLAVRAEWPAAEAEAFLDGFLELAAAHGVALVGGNITRSPAGLIASVTAWGSVRRRRILRRDGARPGDHIYVTGTIGAGGAGLRALADAAGEPTRPLPEPLLACARRYRRPEPRVRLGRLLGRARAATSCIDLSDGLADGLHRLAEASGLGFVVEEALVPVDQGARALVEARGGDPVLQAAAWGDDYELLFTSSPRMRRALEAVVRLGRGLPVTRIGVVTREPGVRVRRGDREDAMPEGYAHF
ncbi:MAG TPA: thiamine-phosphate kinase [Vicinamibacterales bacterium]|nr:thiamine-phosphate kinase [Vicinamibacterales bacterium]